VCKVYVSVFGDERGKKVAIDGLKAKTKYVRSQIGKRMKLRLTPEIRFIEDESMERGSRVGYRFVMYFGFEYTDFLMLRILLCIPFRYLMITLNIPYLLSTVIVPCSPYFHHRPELAVVFHFELR